MGLTTLSNVIDNCNLEKMELYKHVIPKHWIEQSDRNVIALDCYEQQCAYYNPQYLTDYEITCKFVEIRNQLEELGCPDKFESLDMNDVYHTRWCDTYLVKNPPNHKKKSIDRKIDFPLLNIRAKSKNNQKNKTNIKHKSEIIIQPKLLRQQSLRGSVKNNH